MAVSFYSASWHRVADLKPRLRAHVRLHRQVYRGDVWFVIQDDQSGRFHRFGPETHLIVTLMDGVRTMEEIWTLSTTILGARQPSQDDLIALLTFFHNGDLLLSGKSPDLEELSRRSERMERLKILSRIRNPMALRIPLFDPNRFLDETLPLVRWLFSWKGALLWLLLIFAGLIMAVQNMAEMTSSVLEQVLTTNNLFLLAGIYPVMKGLHEMGHAYAVKRWGGEVHEVGVMLLILMPAPYVDASASIGFSDKWKRAVVGAAGIAVEMALAAIAVVVWSLSEPGQVRAVALNVAVLGSVSTLLFNGNPLLRFDGYYVFQDIIESPNIGTRANDYFFYLVKQRILGIENVKRPTVARGEAGWLVGYAILSFLYRMLVMAGIALYIAGKFFFIGVALAVMSVFGGLVQPLLKGLGFLLQDPSLGGRRIKAMIISGGAMAALLGFLFLVPMPYNTVATGILWVDEDEATVRAGSDGFISMVRYEHPTLVQSGDALVDMVNRELSAEAALSEAKRSELKIKYDAADVTDHVKAALLKEELAQETARRAEYQAQLDSLKVAAMHSGIFIPIAMMDFNDRFRKRGSVLGYLVRPEDRIVRLVVPQSDIQLVRDETAAISVRLSDDPQTSFAAQLLREQPGAVTRLPSPALSGANGGPVATDPTDPDSIKPLETVYELHVSVSSLPGDTRLGQRVFVRFQHPAQPWGYRIVRQVRQVFLRTFNV
jgi:putative peptide zinc metalloprotease protein